MASRIEIVEENLERALQAADTPGVRLMDGDPLRSGHGLTAGTALRLFEDQVTSRAIDVAARELRREGYGYYTISSAGHEQNAVLGELSRTTDPAYLHYRAGALMLARARRYGGIDAVRDTLLGICAAREDPISGGRHKVWGSRPLWILPQTSTAGSHLPKAVGMAFALGRAGELAVEIEVPEDSIVLCSFGDASANHASALAGINAARWTHRLGGAVPILFVCEDNGIGISVETPRRWIQDTFSQLSHLEYLRAAGDLDEIFETAAGAVARCRSARVPVFLHLETVRLWGHAGSDVESAYRSVAEIEAQEARDPLPGNARLLIETGAASPEELRACIARARDRVRSAAAAVSGSPRLQRVSEIAAPIERYDPEACRASAEAASAAAARRSLFPGGLPEEARAPSRRTLGSHLGSALADEMLRRPEMLVFGQDVGKKGGVYAVTSGLQSKFGRARVFDTLLDETSILGVAQGAAHIGLLPVPEIQYLAFLHNALDQLRGEACSLGFFSAGQFQNPLVVRVAGLGYQSGFGGHFHNDDSIGALRDIPGLLLAVPARGDDAARMLRGALALARECGRVVCFLEPIALYHEKDLHAPGDGGWLFDYPPPGGAALLPGEPGVYGASHSELLLVSYANGLRLSLRAARELEHAHGIRARVLDLRWLAPLPFEAVRAHAEACGRVLVVDECRATGGGVADALIADLAEAGYGGGLRSVRSADSYVPLGPAADAVLVSQQEIVEEALSLCGSGGPRSAGRPGDSGDSAGS